MAAPDPRHDPVPDPSNSTHDITHDVTHDITHDVTNDPVLARRAKVAHWTLLANRVGYLVLALAMSLFVLAFLFGFTAPMATAIIVALVVSFALLAPSIVIGYGVKAADRADRDDDW